MTKPFCACVIAAVLACQAALAQQEVHIAPGDDVAAILATVTEPGSRVTFEPGYYRVTPTAGTVSQVFDIPSDTTVIGAGGGFDPATSTILDMEYGFSNGFRTQEGALDIVVEGITLYRCIGHIVQARPGDTITFNDVWMISCFDELIEITGVFDFNFNNCVFGYDGDELIKAEGGGTSIMRFVNCDFFCSVVNYVEAEAGSDLLFVNSIFYTGSGRASDNFENENGIITLRNSIAYDAVPDDRVSEYPHPNDGGMTVIGTNGEFTIDGSVTGEDPMYVVRPSFGNPLFSIDLRLQPGSPALTAGSTSWDEFGNATGEPTWAGSQGPGPDGVDTWSLF